MPFRPLAGPATGAAPAVTAIFTDASQPVPAGVEAGYEEKAGATHSSPSR